MTTAAGSARGVEPLNELANQTGALKSTRKLSRSSSIKHLISFYETAYTKKSVDESANVGHPKFQRQISTPVIRYSESLHFKSKLHRDATLLLSQKRNNYVNTPLSSYSTSLSSSSSSSSAEKLSFSSFKEESIKNIDAGSQSTLSSPSSNLLCSVSSTSASSASTYSSGYSSPSLSELLTSEHALPSTEQLDKQISNNSNNNCNKPSKTNSFTDLQAGLVSAKQRFTKYKFNNASLTKLFDKGKQAPPKEKDKEKEPPLNDLMNYFIQFKSIKKVLSTVKLCNNSDKCATFANATARIPEEEPEHESAVEVKLSPVNSIELDSPARNANEETSIKMNNSQQAKPSTHLDTRKKPNLTKLTSAPNGNF